MSELPFSTSGTVHLLQAVKLPPRKARVVRVEGCGASKDRIFEADLNEELQSRGVTIAETLVEPNEDGLVSLVVENHGSEPVWLPSGQALGGIEPVGVCEEVDPDGAVHETLVKCVLSWITC